MDSSMKVHEKPPEGFEIKGVWANFKTARVPVKTLLEQRDAGTEPDFREFYECKYCDGWIEGSPSSYREDNIGHLCGRRGETFSCIRCGREIGFTGMVS